MSLSVYFAPEVNELLIIHGDDLNGAIWFYEDNLEVELFYIGEL